MPGGHLSTWGQTSDERRLLVPQRACQSGISLHDGSRCHRAAVSQVPLRYQPFAPIIYQKSLTHSNGNFWHETARFAASPQKKRILKTLKRKEMQTKVLRCIHWHQVQGFRDESAAPARWWAKALGCTRAGKCDFPGFREPECPLKPSGGLACIPRTAAGLVRKQQISLSGNNLAILIKILGRKHCGEKVKPI